MDHTQFLSDATSYAQRNQLYENDGGRFSDISAGAGEYFREELISRGVAFGDWDNDGDPDLLVANNNEAPQQAQGVREVVVRLGVVRLEIESLPEVTSRLFEPASHGERHAEIIVRLLEARFELESATEVDHGLFELSS